LFTLWLLAAARPSLAVDSLDRVKSRDVFGYDPKEEFRQYDPDYPAKHHRYVEQLETLQRELALLSSKGRATPCSRQLFLEARWLVFYSAHWAEIEERLAALRDMLAQPSDPAHAREQVPEDGSFDHCSHAWFLKLDSTIEEVEDRGENGIPVHLPLKLLDRINTPEKLRAYLDSVLVSEVRKTGIDNRFELNIAITAIERFLVGHVIHSYPFPPGLKEALFEYQDRIWQDPQTGFFGGWYRLPDGSLRKTADLSVTFHIVSYRRDSIRRVPEMMQTLLAMKDREYPFGWLEEGRSSNHHNYDVVRLFRVGWPAMSEEQRAQARTEMRRMMDFCLRETMNADGSFKMMDEDTLGSSFLFPISLLNELGYFRPSLRFWTSEAFPDAMNVADKVEHRIRTMGLTDTESAKVLRRFRDARLEQTIRRAILGTAVATALVCGIVAWWFMRKRKATKLCHS
jgi:hypothetical protein